MLQDLSSADSADSILYVSLTEDCGLISSRFIKNGLMCHEHLSKWPGANDTDHAVYQHY